MIYRLSQIILIDGITTYKISSIKRDSRRKSSKRQRSLQDLENNFLRLIVFKI